MKNKCTKCGERAMFGVNGNGVCLPCRNEARLEELRAHAEWALYAKAPTRVPFSLEVWDEVPS